MAYKDEINKEIINNLKIDCRKCFGFCCTALYFSKCDGFPNDKEAGKPCINLKQDFKCKIHNELRKKGLKGCTAYDCFGAGQKTAQVTYKGKSWRESPELANQMYDVFLIVRQIHEMLWYLVEAYSLEITNPIHDKLEILIEETESKSNLNADAIMKLDIESHRDKVNKLLRVTSEMVRGEAIRTQRNSKKSNKKIAGRSNFLGANLTKYNLIGADFRGALLIAANLSNTDLTGADFIAADMRDADFRGADLSESIFITQSQINTIKGDSNTKIPKSLVRPDYWNK